MALLANAQMTVAAAPGTGTVSLGAATPGAQSWAAGGAANGAVYSYRIEEGANWEIGLGTYGSSGSTLARSTVLASSAGGAAVGFGAGAVVSQVFLPADLTGLDGRYLQLSGGALTGPLQINNPSVHVKLNADVTLYNGYNLLNLDNYNHSRGGTWNGTRFTAPVAGIYLISANVVISGGAVDVGSAGIVLFFNGFGQGLKLGGRSSALQTVSDTQVLYFAVGDYLEFNAVLDAVAGTVVAKGVATQFSAVFLS